MRGIGKENIEEWLFQYHEDLLDATQKQDLLHFLVQNPEYNDDFMLWGSARLSVEEVRIPEAFTSQLKRKNPAFAWYSYVWQSFGLSVCLSLLSVYFLQPSLEVEVPKTMPVMGPPTIPIVEQEKMSNLQTDRPVIAKTRTVGKEQRDMVPLGPNLAVMEDTAGKEAPLSLPPLALDSQVHMPHRYDLGASLHLLPADSLGKQPVKPEFGKAPKTSQKLAPFSIKPVEEFQTDHPNF